MSKKNRNRGMVVATCLMLAIAAIMVAAGYFKGGGEHITGLKNAFNMTIQILPLLLAAFVVAGMIQVLIPQALIARWVGAESGFRGIVIGTIAGGLSPGGPYVSLPIAAGLLNAGASVGTMVAYLTGWSLWAVARLPMEVGIMGWRFTVIRVISTILLPFIAGLIAEFFFSSGNLPG
jgi:uncharacterized membrane protein YraQ (UPF0718 family)